MDLSIHTYIFCMEICTSTQLLPWSATSAVHKYSTVIPPFINEPAHEHKQSFQYKQTCAYTCQKNARRQPVHAQRKNQATLRKEAPKVTQWHGYVYICDIKARRKNGKIMMWLIHTLIYMRMHIHIHIRVDVHAYMRYMKGKEKRQILRQFIHARTQTYKYVWMCIRTWHIDNGKKDK
jgi:hypothetical protein